MKLTFGKNVQRFRHFPGCVSWFQRQHALSRNVETKGRNAGFHNVQVQDQKEDFLAVLHRELERFREQRQQFVEEFSETDFRDTVIGWEQKIARATEGSQVWGLISAQKPADASAEKWNRCGFHLDSDRWNTNENRKTVLENVRLNISEMPAYF